MFLAGESKSWIAAGELNSSFPLGMANEDDCENKFAGENNSVGG